MASKGALPPGAWRRAAGRKENSLQGIEIAHFAEGKENPGAAFPIGSGKGFGHEKRDSPPKSAHFRSQSRAVGWAFGCRSRLARFGLR
jgi:hypothetical protein